PLPCRPPPAPLSDAPHSSTSVLPPPLTSTLFPYTTLFRSDWYAENARLLRATGKAVVGTQRSSLGDPSEIEGPQVPNPTGIRGYQDWSMAQLLYPEYVREVLEMWTEAGLKNLEIYKQAVGDNIDIINISCTHPGTPASGGIRTGVWHSFFIRNMSEKYWKCGRKQG